MTDEVSVTPEYMRDWGRHAHGSPLYRHLVEVVAGDDELLRVINRIEHKPYPNMLFAAVQFLLMEDRDAPLRDFYPSLVDTPRPVEDVSEAFRDFVVEHQAEIVEIGRSRYTQTNEAKRCAALLPAVWHTGVDRFHLVEVGASAGLNLAMDRYRYRWGEVEWGPESGVVLESGSRGGRVSPRQIEILTRTGLDLNPIDAFDSDQRRWLTALVWPEHHERRARLIRALDLVRQVDIEFVRGDATSTLSTTLGRLPTDDPVIVLNSMALMQFSREQRMSLYGVLAEERARRPLYRVSFEILAAGDEWVTMQVDKGAGLAQVGQAHPHGEWIELYARP